jgi:transformation/transcription domain-associated protein
VSFERGDGEKLIGSPPAPDSENSENIISNFILDLIDPDNPFGTSDAVRILLLQLSCLLVDQGNDNFKLGRFDKSETMQTCYSGDPF